MDNWSFNEAWMKECQKYSIPAAKILIQRFGYKLDDELGVGLFELYKIGDIIGWKNGRLYLWEVEWRKGLDEWEAGVPFPYETVHIPNRKLSSSSTFDFYLILNNSCDMACVISRAKIIRYKEMIYGLPVLNESSGKYVKDDFGDVPIEEWKSYQKVNGLWRNFLVKTYA